MKKNIVILSALLSSVCFASLSASYAVKEGKFLDAKYLATMPAQDHYNEAMDALEAHKWSEVVRQFKIIQINYPSSPFAMEALFYVGVGFYYLEDYDLANQNLSEYLSTKSSSKHFEEAMQYKYAIAEAFRKGAKKHMFGMERLPEIMSAKEEALEIYDEIIASVPSHDLAARSLYSKGHLLRHLHDFKASVDAFITITKRFPKHELTPKAFLAIEETYLLQAKVESHNPDLLALAEINVRKFRENFPTAPELQEAEAFFSEVQETFATSLYETGQFYERTKHPQASAIYYATAVAQYPSTKAAVEAKERLNYLEQKFHVQTFLEVR